MQSNLAGSLEEVVFPSTALADNVLGDPADRPLLVYLPPGYHDEDDRRYPTVYVIQGYGGQPPMWRNRLIGWRDTFPEAADKLFSRGEVPPCILVFPDGWTRFGGSQYVDSPGTGRYHSYLCDEVVPWVDGRYRTIAHRDHRGIQGKSSGGFAAMITPMLRPDLFGALASHAGDSAHRAVRRQAWRHRLPLPAVAGLPRHASRGAIPPASVRLLGRCCRDAGDIGQPRVMGTRRRRRRPDRPLQVPGSPAASGLRPAGGARRPVPSAPGHHAGEAR